MTKIGARTKAHAPLGTSRFRHQEMKLKQQRNLLPKLSIPEYPLEVQISSLVQLKPSLGPRPLRHKELKESRFRHSHWESGKKRVVEVGDSEVEEVLMMEETIATRVAAAQKVARVMAPMMTTQMMTEKEYRAAQRPARMKRELTLGGGEVEAIMTSIQGKRSIGSA